MGAEEFSRACNPDTPGSIQTHRSRRSSCRDAAKPELPYNLRDHEGASVNGKQGVEKYAAQSTAEATAQ